MKTIIFSDTHLTDVFDESKFLYLRRIISSADKVIINGDFWKGTVVDFDDFADSKWNKLFPLLLSKQAIYIHGNHDDSFLKQEPALFAVANMKEHTLKTMKYTYQITHGDKLTMPNLINKSFTILQRTIDRKLKTHKLSEMKQQNRTKLFGYPKFKGNIIFNNKIAKNGLKLSEGEILVCGHSHVPTFDIENQYINDGFVDFGMAYHLEITSDGVPRLIKNRL